MQYIKLPDGRSCAGSLGFPPISSHSGWAPLGSNAKRRALARSLRLSASPLVECGVVSLSDTKKKRAASVDDRASEPC